MLMSNDEMIIVEIKGIIASRRTVSFPSVYSERAIEQLKKIKEILRMGVRVVYIITSLSPMVKKIVLDYHFKKYHQLLNECIELGMEIRSFSLKFEGSEIKYNNRVKFIL